MTYLRPPCPLCGSSRGVKTKGGGSAGKYRYACSSCCSMWQQEPLHKPTPNRDPPQISKRKLGVYKCTACGMPKRGHVCRGFGNG